MENMLSLLGLLFFLLLMLSAAVEVILEMIRALLAAAGLPFARKKISLDEAMALADEFAPEGTDASARIQALRARLDAVKSAAAQLGWIRNMDALREVKTLDAASNEGKAQKSDDQASDVVQAGAADAQALELHRMAALVEGQLRREQSFREYFMRALAAVVGCALVWWSDFHVLRIVAASAEAGWMKELPGLQSHHVNVVVGGLAAAAGSSYWHDQLDRIRQVKQVAAALKQGQP